MSSYICLASHKDLIKLLSAAHTELCHVWAASTILLFADFCTSPHGRQYHLPCLLAPFQSLLGPDDVYLQPFFLNANRQQAAEKGYIDQLRRISGKKAESLASEGKNQLSAADSDSTLQQSGGP